eukprot:8759368-Pyramimonas_sp.AAC.1
MDVALFQGLRGSPATTQASKAADAHGSFDGRATQQAGRLTSPRATPARELLAGFFSPEKNGPSLGEECGIQCVP